MKEGNLYDYVSKEDWEKVIIYELCHHQKIGDVHMMSWDVAFDREPSNDVQYKFANIPLPTSATRLNSKRVIFSLITTNPYEFNSSYLFRFLVMVEKANGAFSSVNGRSREDWDYLFKALGPPNEWEDYDSPWPTPQ